MKINLVFESFSVILYKTQFCRKCDAYERSKEEKLIVSRHVGAYVCRLEFDGKMLRRAEG